MSESANDHVNEEVIPPSSPVVDLDTIIADFRRTGDSKVAHDRLRVLSGTAEETDPDRLRILLRNLDSDEELSVDATKP